MAVLTWDQTGKKYYETGTKKTVLFVQNADGTYQNGVAWDGVTAITESPSGAEETALWADDIKYLSLRSREELGGTIEAYQYPDEWGVCDGSASPATGVTIGQQARKSFGLAFQTAVGNDTEFDAHAYKLHLIYGASASVSERAYQTINDSPEAITFSWEFTTIPVAVAGYNNTSIITIDTRKLTTTEQKAALKKLEDKLFGTEGTESTLPTPAWVIATFAGEETEETHGKQS